MRASAGAADKLAKQVTAIEAALPGYLERSRILSDLLSEIGHWHFESHQIEGYINPEHCGSIEVAANFALAELKAMPKAIRGGSQAIPGEPTAAPVAAPEPEPPTMTVFMMRSAHYRDHDARKRFGGQWENATVPVATAQRALSQGVAVQVTDRRRAELRGMGGGDFNPKAADVVDLDAVEKPKDLPHIEADPVLREAGFTGFTVIDRSAETRTIQIEVLPPIAARAATPSSPAYALRGDIRLASPLGSC